MIKHVMIVETTPSRRRDRQTREWIDIPATKCEVVVSMEDRLILHQCAMSAARNRTGHSKILNGLIQGKVIKRDTIK